MSKVATRKMYFIFIFCFFVVISYSQEKIEILKQKLNNLSETESIPVLNEISAEYSELNPGKAYKYAKSALELSQKYKLKNQEALSYKNIGKAYYYNGSLNKSIDNFQKALIIFYELTDNNNILQLYNDLGLVYKAKENYNKSLDMHNKAILLANEINNIEYKAQTYVYIGNVQLLTEDYNSSMINFNNALKIYESDNNQKQISNIYYCFGQLYENMGNYDKAMEYYKKGLIINESLNDKLQISYSLNFIAGICAYQKKYELALNYYKRSLDIKTAIKDNEGISKTLYNIGNIYVAMGNNSLAREYFTKSLVNASSCKLSKTFNLISNNLFNIYTDVVKTENADYEQKKYKDSVIINNIDKAKTANDEKSSDKEIKLLKEIESLNNEKQLKDIEFLSKIQEITNEYNKRATELSIKEDELEKQKVLIQNTIDENERKIELLRKEKQIKDLMLIKNNERIEHQKRLIILFTIAFILILITSVLFTKEFIQKKKAYKLLENKNAEITRQNEEIQSKNSEIEAQRDEIEAQRDSIEIQRDIAIKQKKEITDSISYAKRIQQAILPSEKYIKDIFPDSFILYMPKDIVSGDFYFFHKENYSDNEEKIFFSAADCTGHGVPGAFLSIVGYNILNQAINEYKLISPSDILKNLNDNVYKVLRKNKEFDHLHDGMDLTLCSYSKTTGILEFAGAYNPLYIFKKDEFLKLRGDSHPIGETIDDDFVPYHNHSINLEKGDILYLLSDGFVDQFGGPKYKKFSTKQFIELLNSIKHFEMEEQKVMLSQTLDKWKNDAEQIDDILVIGIRV